MHKDFKTIYWKELLEKLPELEELKKVLTEFSNVNFSGMSMKEIDEVYFKDVPIWPGISFKLPKKLKKTLTFYRVRNKVNLEKENIHLISTFSYPPSSVCSKNGRANILHAPVFYCSDNIATSYVEIKPDLNEIAFLSVWEIDCDREIKIIPILANNISEKNSWRPFSINVTKYIDKITKEVGYGKSKEMQLLYNFFSYWFATEKYPYYKTSWIANKYLYHHSDIDFIVYPSIESSLTNCSIAVHPNFADKYLKLVRVFSYSEVIEDNKNIVKIRKVGKPSKTNIFWADPVQEDVECFWKISKYYEQLINFKL